MSFFDHIKACNTHDLTGFMPFYVAESQVGWVRPAFAETLRRYTEAFTVGDDSVTLAAGLDGYAMRTAAVDRVLRDLASRSLIEAWTDEPYPVGGGFAGPHLLEMERAAVAHFGVRAHGVHINGFVRDGDAIDLWIARRADDRAVCPGQLDNMIAGGQPVGLGLLENVIKEAGEEAAVPPELAAAARPVGAVSYCMEAPQGLKPDVMFCYDLELPDDFIPANTDGEIAEFFRWPAAKVMEIVETSFDFKFNCNLVNLDFFVRHGLIPPDHPDYVDIVRGLHR